MSATSKPFTIDAGEGEAIWFLGALAEVKASRERTANVLALVDFTLPPGFATPWHVHHMEEEAFYILDGKLEGFCGDRPWEGTSGTFVWLPPDIPHGFRVAGTSNARKLVITHPAGFDRFVAEVGEPARSRTLPPPSEPDMEKLLAAAAKCGMEILAPPGQWPPRAPEKTKGGKVPSR